MTLYIVGAPNIHRYKFGYTKNLTTLTKRLSTLQIGSPLRLILYGVSLDGTKKDEKRLHHDLLREGARKVHGEWFQLTPSIFALLYSRYDFSSVQRAIKLGINQSRLIDNSRTNESINALGGNIFYKEGAPDWAMKERYITDTTNYSLMAKMLGF